VGLRRDRLVIAALVESPSVLWAVAVALVAHSIGIPPAVVTRPRSIRFRNSRIFAWSSAAIR